MHSLRDLQLEVMRAVLEGEPHLAAPFVAAQGISARQRLNVYANTARHNFIDSLVLSFPVLQRLVGEEYFRQCACAYHARHPSLSGDLQFAGLEFPQFLQQLNGAGEYRYLGDVARLEWLIQETLLAGKHAPFDLAKLQAVAPADYDALRFCLHPSVRLFASEFPCTAIWEANAGGGEPDVIDLGSGPDRLLIMRLRGELAFHRLSSGELQFLESLRAEAPFAAAVARAAADGAEGGLERGTAAGRSGFDAAAALQRFVPAGVIVDFH